MLGFSPSIFDCIFLLGIFSHSDRFSSSIFELCKFYADSPLIASDVFYLFAGQAGKFNQLCIPKVEKNQQTSAASVIIPLSRVAERLRNTSLRPGSISLLKQTL